MKGFQITFLIIFISALSLQGIRHVHNYIFRYDESIVAPVEEFFEMKQEIREEVSTEELLSEFESVQLEIEKIRDEYEEQEGSTEDRFKLQREHPELMARQESLRSELIQREAMSEKLRDTWVFSIAGMILVALGALVYSRGRQWLGMAFVLPGLIELQWWSAPAFSMGGAQLEYQLLLINKIILTVIAMAIVIVLWSRLVHDRKT
jgi:hypothetical protein